MKKNNKFLKIMLIIIASVIVCSCVNVKNVYAADGLTWSNISEKAKKFIKIGSDNEQLTQSQIEDDMIPIARIMVIVANAVVVIVIGIMAIRWITAKPDQSAKLKEQLIGLVVSVIVIYGAVGIWSLIKNFMQGLPI